MTVRPLPPAEEEEGGCQEPAAGGLAPVQIPPNEEKLGRGVCLSVSVHLSRAFLPIKAMGVVSVSTDIVP